MTATVEIYTKNYCPYCHKAKALLDKKGIAYSETDLTLEPAKKPEMVERAEGRSTVPQIFINGEGIGGCDDLHALEAKGKLDTMLSAEPA
jgi:glutaredoxin 3